MYSNVPSVLRSDLRQCRQPNGYGILVYLVQNLTLKNGRIKLSHFCTNIYVPTLHYNTRAKFK